MSKLLNMLFVFSSCLVGLSACGQQDSSPQGSATDSVVDARGAAPAAVIAEALSSGNYGKAAEAANAALATDPSNPELYFLLARAEARLQNVGSAVKALQASFDSGFHDPRGALNNPDFDGIRDNPIFTAFANGFRPKSQQGSSKTPAAPTSRVTAGNVSIVEGPNGETSIRAGDLIIED